MAYAAILFLLVAQPAKLPYRAIFYAYHFLGNFTLVPG